MREVAPGRGDLPKSAGSREAAFGSAPPSAPNMTDNGAWFSPPGSGPGVLTSGRRMGAGSGLTVLNDGFLGIVFNFQESCTGRPDPSTTPLSAFLVTGLSVAVRIQSVLKFGAEPPGFRMRLDEA